MLLLLPSELPSGTIAKGVSDTASIQADEGNLSDFFIQTLDGAGLTLGEAANLATRVDRAEFALLSLADAASVQITTGTILVAGSDALSVQLLESATVLRTPALIAGTETASLSLAEVAALAVALAVSDTASVTLTDAGVIDLAAVKLVAETCALTLSEAGVVVPSNDTKTPSDTAALIVLEGVQVAVSVSGTESANVALGESSAILQDQASALASDTARLTLGEAAAIFSARAASDTASLALLDVGASSIVVDVTHIGGDLALVKLEERAVRAVLYPVDLIVFTFGEDSIIFRL